MSCKISTKGNPQWLKGFEAQQKPSVINGITYREKSGAHQCLIVRDYADLTDCAKDFNELLCADSPGGVFVDLGDAPNGHNLIINVKSGKVYVNGYIVTCMIGLQSLGDGSWAVVFGDNELERPRGILGWLISIYSNWLDVVYSKCSALGLIEINPLHNKSIWHLITDDLPKGKIISKKVQIST